jgi:eukaryotic-like serine/threonine-protein kinase
MTAFDVERWRHIAPYLDEVLDIASDQARASWLAALRLENAALADDLQMLLDDQRDVAARQFLEHGAVSLPEALSGGQPIGPPKLVPRVDQAGMGSVRLAKRGDERFDRYEIVSLLGEGGMGQVYGATDTRLDRVVAIKMLFERLAGDPVYRERFEREARSAAALNHPHICTIFDVGPDYLVMERLEGETLADVLTRGPLPVNQAIDYGVQIADALAAAHARGIVHRDLKPANVMITAMGAKVLDFGLAKQIARMDEDAPRATLTAVEAETRAGQVVGTAAYMSPEQVEGKPVDGRSDLFAFGALLYEMLGGRRPFSGDTTLSTLASVLKASPDPLRRVRRDIPESVERVVMRCLEKNPAARYASAAEIRRELMRLQAPDQSRHRFRLAAMIVAGGIVLGIAGLAVLTYVKARRVTWVEQTATPEIARLLASDRPFAALKLYREAERADPASRALVAFSEALYAPTLSIQTTPPGAEVYLSDYVDARLGDASWELLGVTPLKTDRIPHNGYYRIRVSKAGFASIERPFDPVGLALSPSAGHLDLTLQSGKLAPPDMIWVDAAAAGVSAISGLTTPAPVPGFWLDKHEVNNRQFKSFVDAGGYRTQSNWKEPFVEGSRRLPWGDAIPRLLDTTSRGGPATWQLGTYPDGTADLPVGGVSWYEAAAYCDSVQKKLPTAYHWYQAAGAGLFSSILQLSNFSGHGPQPVGTNRGLSQYGALDMAGNVKEWSASPVGSKRAILGGSWNEASYTFGSLDADQPFKRHPTFGFRCARFVESPPALLFEPVTAVTGERRGDKPADDAAFHVYAALHRYDRTDLAARTESMDDSKPYFRRETVTFRAAYGNDRVVAHLYVPKNTTPPYQTVVFVPSANAFVFQSIDTLPDPFEFLVRAGRAVLVVAVQGTLERGPSPMPVFVGPNQTRDRLLQWSKDIQRSIDYLETRPEIDMRKLAFYGISYSAYVSPTLLAPEPRLKAAVVVSGGASMPTAPEVDPWNYAPRVKVPVLMLNGRDDFIFPVKRSQIPLLRALGTPERDKRHILFDGGHVNLQTRMDLIGEILRWLDQYLGPVKITS